MQASALLKKIVALTGDLPTIPYTAQLVLQKLANPEVSVKKLEEIILQDPSLSARILKLANSPFYGRPRTIKTITEATVVIGLNTLKSLVIASAVREFLKNFGLVEKLLWEHSLSVAFIARHLATKRRLKNPEELFLGGLLHDIGKIILQIKATERMTTVIETLYSGETADSIKLELEVFGFTHAHVGQLVARKWQFAYEIEEAIGYHHWPARAKLNPTMCYIINLANHIAHKLGIGPIGTPDIELSSTISAEALNLDKATLDKIIEECKAKLEEGVGDIFS